MFGSKQIQDLAWRDSWAFISKKKNTWYAEAHQKSPKFDEWGPPLVVQATVELEPESTACQWGDDATAERRKQFCSKYEGYGTVCSCKIIFIPMQSYWQILIAIDDIKFLGRFS